LQGVSEVLSLALFPGCLDYWVIKNSFLAIKTAVYTFKDFWDVAY